MAVRKKRKKIVPNAKKTGRKKEKPKKISRAQRRRHILKKIAKFQALLVGLFLALYLAVGFWLGLGAIRQDIEGKVAGASTVLSIHIAGPPAKPVVTAAPGCNSSSPYVQLSWDATNDTDNYDINRDGAPLITGITATSYKDTSVSAQTSYAYQVTANGPLGSATSDEASATTGDCYVPPVPAACDIITMGNIDLASYVGVPETTDRTPTFTETANIPYALMRLEIHSGPFIIATAVANINGYWSFTVPTKLNYGLHTVYITATDPADSARYFTDSQNFKVVEEEEEESSAEKKKKKETSAAIPSTQTTPSAAVPSEETAPFALKLEVVNKDSAVFGGSDLLINLSIEKLRDFEETENLVKYAILDANGKEVLKAEEKVMLKEGMAFPQKIKIPDYIKAGKYQVRAETEADGFFVSASSPFEIKEKPVINLGGGMVITYPTLVSSIGYVFLAMFLLLIIFLLLVAREYWLTRQARFFVDEEELKREGYIS